MQTIQDIAKRLSPIIGKEKTDMILYKYNAINDFNRKKRFEDRIRLLAYKLLGTDYEDKILLNPPEGSKENIIGSIIYDNKKTSDFGISDNELLMHTAILGRSGSGKTNVVYCLLKQLMKNKTPFLIFDWKKNYRKLLLKEKDLLVFTPGLDVSPLYFNPLIPPPNVAPKIWKEFLASVIGYSYFIGR